MQNQKLKYISYTLTLQEVPDEISLVINISGCPHRCDGCHSNYLWEYAGKYLSDGIDNIIKQYENLFTCVCFMGGDQNINELRIINSHCKSLGYKTCLYSGSNKKELFEGNVFDYIKTGRYISKLGGLDSVKTNQKMFKLINGSYIDITKIFHRKR